MSRITRRSFLRHASSTVAATAAFSPWLVRAQSPNEKLRLAFVGSQGQAGFSIDSTRHEHFTAIADVDRSSLNSRLEELDKHPNHPQKPKPYTDFRQMLDKEHASIDAVVVATPDHIHAHAALRAINLGKHVYCEKPLAHTVYEVRKMIEATRKHKVATQMGTQIHAGDNYRRAVELIEKNAIGPVHEAHVWVGGSGYHGAQIPDRKEDVPEHLDWDLWLGPAPYRDYHAKIYHPFYWRGWWDFGGGHLSDLSCHRTDVVHWALKLTHPHTVQSFGPDPEPQRCPRSQKVDYYYPNPNPGNGGKDIKVTWYHGGIERREGLHAKYKLPDWGNGVLFVGSEGQLIVEYGDLKLLPEEKFRDYKRPDPYIPASIGHHAEWLKACREGTPTTCNFEYSGTLTEAVLLGLVSHRVGNQKIEFDPATLKVKNIAAANDFIHKEYRKGWEL